MFILFIYFQAWQFVAGLKLYNSAQVPVGTNVSIDISGLPRSTAVFCDLSLDETWEQRNIIDICNAVPPDICDVQTQFHGRARYINETTLQIKGVLRNESGIYRCRIGPSSHPPVIISGVIIVGMSILCCVSNLLRKFTFKPRNTFLREKYCSIYWEKRKNLTFSRKKTAQ